MSRVFAHAKFFDGDLSKWDVSSAKDMSGMFLAARSFNCDLSKWDVSSVNTMPAMFRWAISFNGDVSNWDVSRVTNMDYIFWDATLFNRKLCGAAWVHSRVRRTTMFAGSSGSISEEACMTTSVFSPKSNEELKSAVDAHLGLSPKGDSSASPHGPIEPDRAVWLIEATHAGQSKQIKATHTSQSSQIEQPEPRGCKRDCKLASWTSLSW